MITQKILINKFSTKKIGTNHNKIVAIKTHFILNLEYIKIDSIYSINVISNISIPVIYSSLLFLTAIETNPPKAITVIIAGTSHFSMPW